MEDSKNKEHPLPFNDMRADHKNYLLFLWSNKLHLTGSQQKANLEKCFRLANPVVIHGKGDNKIEYFRIDKARALKALIKEYLRIVVK